MEILVKTNEVALKHLLDVWDGTILPPANVEGLIALVDLGPETLVERLLIVTQQDFGDIPYMLANLPSMELKTVLILSRRIGWIVEELTNWDPGKNISKLRLEAALASVAACACGETFWKLLRPRLWGRRLTMVGFETVLRSREARASIPENTPTWEREVLQDLLEAERTADWARLGEHSSVFTRLPRTDVGAREATSALAFLDWPRLVGIGDKVDGWWLGHTLLEPLDLKDALCLATASKSGHLRFTALERVARREIRDLSPNDEIALRNLLIVLAKDKIEWPSWLTIFNRYPVRHHHMQVAIGRALAFCEPHATQAYVDSISLTTSDTKLRACVTRCLSAFRAKTKNARRCILWQQAFNRWRVWDFAIGEGRGLTDIARCALDFAVVGWLIEAEPPRSLEELEIAFERDLHALNTQWHGSFTSAISGFYRLISRYQVMAHAVHQSESSLDWVPGQSVYVPRSASEFVKQSYRWFNF